MLSLDIYVNETTRHADVILPGPGPLEKPHYDLALYQLATRNVANFSPAVLPPNGVPQEWETLARLAGIVSGQGPNADVDGVDEMVIGALVAREVGEAHSRIAGRDQAEILAELEPRRGPERILDLLLRTGPYGDAFGDDPDGLTLARLEESPHGIDLGPLTAAPARGAAHRLWQGRAGPGRAGGRRAPAGRGARAQGRRPRAGGPPPAALQQLVDAQPEPAGEGQGPLHGPRASHPTPSGWAWPTAPWRACAPARARSRRPWRSPTR